MNRDFDTIDCTRLWDAAEAVLAAVKQIVGETGAPAPDPEGLLGTENQPECLAPFTREEVRSAAAFLVRMGFLSRAERA